MTDALATETACIDLPLQTRADVQSQPDTIDAEARTVEVVWSTGAAVRRTDLWTGKRYDEVVSLHPAHVDLSRLNSGAPLLNAHGAFDLAGVIGVVERAWIARAGETYEGRALVRFSVREDVEPLWQDVRRHYPQRLGRLCRPSLRGDRAGRPGAGVAGDRLAAGGAVGGPCRRRWWCRLSPTARSHPLPSHLRGADVQRQPGGGRPTTGEPTHGSDDAGGRHPYRRGHRHPPAKARGHRKPAGDDGG